MIDWQMLFSVLVGAFVGTIGGGWVSRVLFNAWDIRQAARLAKAAQQATDDVMIDFQRQLQAIRNAQPGSPDDGGH
jgi:hypothetical protein